VGVGRGLGKIARTSFLKRGKEKKNGNGKERGFRGQVEAPDRGSEQLEDCTRDQSTFQDHRRENKLKSEGKGNRKTRDGNTFVIFKPPL